MDAFSVRPVRPDDVASLCAAVDTVARERRWLAVFEGFPREATAAFVARNLREDYPHVVAADATGRIVGWCDIVPDARPLHAHVGVLGMGVLPACRRRGLGRRLIDAALAAACRRGMLRVELQVRASNAPAIALYDAAGFRREGVRRRAARVDGDFDDVLCMGLVFALDQP